MYSMYSSTNIKKHSVPQDIPAKALSYPIDSSCPVNPNIQVPLRCPYFPSAQPNQPLNGPDYEEIILSAALAQKRLYRQQPQQLQQLHQYYLQQNLYEKQQQQVAAQAQFQRRNEYEANNRRAQAQSTAMPTARNEVPLPQRVHMVQQGQKSAVHDVNYSNQGLDPMKQPQLHEESCQCKCYQQNSLPPQATRNQHDQDLKSNKEQERNHTSLPTCQPAVGTPFTSRNELSQACVPQDPAKWKESSSCGFKDNNTSNSTAATPTAALTTTGASTSDSLPKPNDADIFDGLQQREQQENSTLEQKLFELNQIDSALHSISIRFFKVIMRRLTEDNKKTVLTIMDDVDKAILQIDSVSINDSLAVSQRRKELRDLSKASSEASEHDSEVGVPADINEAFPEPKPIVRVHEQEDEDKDLEDKDLEDTELSGPKPTTAEAESDADPEEETTDEPSIAKPSDAANDDYEYL
ncbi:hypothetical protein BGZ58_003172 [Dissophora ornata]|nr:hypothetical protein BGZ58_003172 [Dissophora ornata]